jgi:hypothetical protein
MSGFWTIEMNSGADSKPSGLPAPEALPEAKIRFSDGNSLQVAFEAFEREYRDNVIVTLNDGREFRLAVFTTRRIARDLERMIELGQAYFAEPAMIVVPELTTELIVKAVDRLAQGSYFDLLVPRKAHVSSSTDAQAR